MGLGGETPQAPSRPATGWRCMPCATICRSFSGLKTMTFPHLVVCLHFEADVTTCFPYFNSFQHLLIIYSRFFLDFEADLALVIPQDGSLFLRLSPVAGGAGGRTSTRTFGMTCGGAQRAGPREYMDDIYSPTRSI